MSIRGKLYTIVVFTTAVFLALSFFNYDTLQKIKIGGAEYQKIILGKDLVADILPPPNYIIESYLMCYELLEDMHDDAAVAATVGYIKDTLFADYVTRKNFWLQDEIFVGDDSRLQGAFLNGSHVIAGRFFDVLNNAYIPAILAKNEAEAREIFSDQLRPMYQDHRKYIDQVVSLANDKNAAIEAETGRLLSQRSLLYVVSSALFIVAVAFFLVLVGNSVAASLNRNIRILRDISGGEGDLTQRIDNARRDETGEMAKYFNLTLDKIREMVSLAKKETRNLREVGGTLSENMGETSAAINQIGANIESISKLTINQAASVTETGATMEQMRNGIATLDRLIEEQASNVAQSTSAVEQMAASIDSVTGSIVETGERMKELTGASERGREELGQATEEIRQIARQSENLLEISGVIQGISSQINLLAMNAAIEAAHAGDSGRGFAVVADEVLKLAESSDEQSLMVAGSLEKVRESIARIGASNESLDEQFTRISGLIEMVAQRESSIKQAMEEQAEGNKQVLEAIRNLLDITQKVKSSSAEMLAGSGQVIAETANLNAMTQEINEGMREMSGGSRQILEVVAKVNELGERNRQYIMDLVAEMEKFRTE